MNEIISIFGVASVTLLIRVTWQLATITTTLQVIAHQQDAHEKRIEKLENKNA